MHSYIQLLTLVNNKPQRSIIQAEPCRRMPSACVLRAWGETRGAKRVGLSELRTKIFVV